MQWNKEEKDYCKALSTIEGKTKESSHWICKQKVILIALLIIVCVLVFITHFPALSARHCHSMTICTSIPKFEIQAY